MDATAARVRTAASATSIVGASMLAMSVLTYAFTLVAAHALGPRPYGALAALLGILIVASVGSLSLQATAARRVAIASREQRAAIATDIERAGVVVSVALTWILLLLVWPIAQFLQISGWSVVLAAIACGPLTIMGAYAGVAQGQHRWGQLAAIYVAMGAGRIVCGAGALLIRQSLIAAMIGLAVGAFAPAVVGRLQRADATLSKSPRRPGQLASELWRNGYSLLAFFVCTNVDVLLARHVLDHHDAGIYAAGAILTKTALFLPAFVLVAAFPSMARDDRPRRWVAAFVTVVVLGLIGIAATIVLPGVAVTYAGGHQYNPLRPDAWLFVLEGVLFALLQILVYDKIAARSSLALLLWLTALVIATIALSAVHSPAALVSVVIIGVGTAIAAGVALSFRTTRRIC